ncbi:MAG TPA: hypothetical protein VF972_11315, partial [Actinomycetota bacterium]
MEQQVVEQHHTPLFEEMHGVGIEDAREAANRLLYPVPTPTDPETRSPGSAPDLGSVEQKAAATVGRWLANGFYARVPASILVAGVTPGAVRLYGVLDLFAMPEFSCYPSRRLLAYILGRSEDAIDDYVSQLEDAGAIAVEPRYTEEGDRTSNLYSLVAGQEAACGRNGGRESPATGPLKNSGTGRRRTSGTVAEVSPTEGQPREGAPSSDARPTMNDTPYVPQGGGEDAQAPNVSEGVPEDV